MIRKKTMFYQRLLVGLLLLFGSQVVRAQHAPPTNILFVFDGSQSMYGLWGNESKIKVATRLLNELVDSLKNNEQLTLALRVYGHQDPVRSGSRNCQDTKLEVPFSKDNHNQIKSRLSSIRPRGTTLIAYSLQQAAGDFPDCKNCRNVIILITDGIEECDGDPCAVSLALQRKGVILKPFVIGLGLDVEIKNAFECVGNFFDAQDENGFREVLNIIISQALNTTSAQVNLLDAYDKPTETDVNMTFYDSFSATIRYNFVHTMNHRGFPDTIPIDPLGEYDLVVHTLPSISKKGIKLNPGKHNVIAVDAAQGDLLLKTVGHNEYRQLQCIVRQQGKMETLTIQEFDQTRRYLVGKYDLEILTLPRTYIKDVDISQSHTTKVEIPQPGQASISLTSTGFASIYEEKNNKMTLIYRLNDNVNRETLIMQPGRYRIVYRPTNSKASVYTKEETFKIVSGQSTQVKL
jgi:Ca-activated chloride channel family protein